jgi:hypothetical protein
MLKFRWLISARASEHEKNLMGDAAHVPIGSCLLLAQLV